MINQFSFVRTPNLHFGVGKISILLSQIKAFGSKVFLITGARHFTSSECGEKILESLRSNKINWQQFSISSEPTPQMIDDIVMQSHDLPDVVVAIGGGSVIDAGKAVSAMLPLHDSVKPYLEGIGTREHPGKKIPFIAIPTTSGTGSEATKNAVLSEVGEHGFKKSLRHINFVPDVVIIDPTLTISCPASITASSGMDAFTQLFESYLSTNSNPISDSLSIDGLEKISSALVSAYNDGTKINARTEMAYASYISGITLANAGLGLVHGFASSIGGYYEIPHGVICSSLMASTNRITVQKLRHLKMNSFLTKYSRVGNLFSPAKSKTTDYYIDFLLEEIESIAFNLRIPKLSKFGINHLEFKRIIEITDNKNNPVALSTDEMYQVLEMSC